MTDIYVKRSIFNNKRNGTISDILVNPTLDSKSKCTSAL